MTLHFWSVMTSKRTIWFLILASLGCFLAGFVCWMIGNPNFKQESVIREFFNKAGLALILLGDVGLMTSMALFCNGWLPAKRIGTFALVAALLSLFSLAMLFLEYGVLNFGDSDLPPYQPDTLFERSFDFVWFVVTGGAGVFWAGIILCALSSLSGFFRRRNA